MCHLRYLVLISTCLTNIVLATGDKPNIILIMADDMGYECVGANGCEDYKTPNLDKMAQNGMRFTNCFANPLCTPSRVKLMTGKYNVRNYVRFGTLARGQKTFAHTLKAAGYRTCVAGKWQLGKETDSPQHFGFDQSCLWQHTRSRTRKGMPNDSRFSNPLLEINGKPKDFSNGEFGPDLCAAFICDFMEENKERPFLVYYPMILTHCPFIPTPGTPDWDPKSQGSPTYKGDPKYFVDMDQHLDKIIGRIIAKLETLTLRENTIVIFTGDNGTDQPVATMMNGKKILGGKGQMNDNGTRVPLIVSFPGHIQAGVTSDELVDFTDILPTLCDVTGTPLPSDGPLDGVSLWSTLQGKPGRHKPWAYFWYGRNGDQNKAHVIARTKTHMVRRMALDGPVELLRCDTPYELEPVEAAKLGEREVAIFSSLLTVVTNFDGARPQALKKR